MTVSVDIIVREGSFEDVTFKLQPKWKDGVGQELECRRWREQQGKGPEAGLSLVSHSFEHRRIVSALKEGKAWAGVGPDHIGACRLQAINAHVLRDVGKQLHTASREGQAPGLARKGLGKASLPLV